MQTIVEVYYIRVIDEYVYYRRKQVDLSNTGQDPQRMIEALIQQKYHLPARKIEEEFVIHSTSWRYTSPGKIILTYVAYSDELEFGQDEAQNLPLEELKIVTISTPRPASPTELEKHVVSHAMRHIAFLVNTDHQRALDQILAPKTKSVFEALWVALAGKIF